MNKNQKVRLKALLKPLINEVKQELKENEFRKIELDKNNLNGIYGQARQVIQNMEILQKDCKNNNITEEGIHAVIQILETSIKKFKIIEMK